MADQEARAHALRGGHGGGQGGEVVASASASTHTDGSGEGNENMSNSMRVSNNVNNYAADSAGAPIRGIRRGERPEDEPVEAVSLRSRTKGPKNKEPALKQQRDQQSDREVRLPPRNAEMTRVTNPSQEDDSSGLRPTEMANSQGANGAVDAQRGARSAVPVSTPSHVNFASSAATNGPTPSGTGAIFRGTMVTEPGSFAQALVGFTRRTADVAVSGRWARVGKTTKGEDVAGAIRRVGVQAEQHWVVQITYKVNRMEQLHDRLLAKVEDNLEADIRLVRQVLSIQRMVEQWNVECRIVGMLRRMRMEVDGWVVSRCQVTDESEHAAWIEQINGLHGRHGVDVTIFCAKEADLKGETVRWRPRFDYVKRERTEPAFKDNWLCASFAKLEKHGVKYPTIHKDGEGHIWAMARDMRAREGGSTVEDDGGLDGITFAGEAPAELYTAIIGPVPTEHSAAVRKLAELISGDLKWSLGRGGWQVDTRVDKHCVVYAVFTGASGPFVEAIPYTTYDEECVARLEVVKGNDRPQRELPMARAYEYVKKEVRTTERRGQQTTATQQDGAAAAAAAAASDPPRAGDDQPAVATSTSASTRKTRTRYVMRAKDSESVGFCCAIAIMEELFRVCDLNLTKEDVQLRVTGKREACAWNAEHVITAAKEFGVTIVASMGAKVYKIGRGQEELYVEFDSKHMASFSEKGLRKFMRVPIVLPGGEDDLRRLSLAMKGGRARKGKVSKAKQQGKNMECVGTDDTRDFRVTTGGQDATSAEGNVCGRTTDVPEGEIQQQAVVAVVSVPGGAATILTPEVTVDEAVLLQTVDGSTISRGEGRAWFPNAGENVHVSVDADLGLLCGNEVVRTSEGVGHNNAFLVTTGSASADKSSRIPPFGAG